MSEQSSYMTTQQEFCWNRKSEELGVKREERTHLLGRLVEHLALCGELVRPVHQIVNLLSALKYRLDCLVL